MRRRKKGRPRLYRNAMQMEAKIAEYFDFCEKNNKPLSVAGLAYHLGFASSHCFRRYSTKCKARSHFSSTINRAVLRIEADKAERLASCKDAGRAKGIIFDLRVNHGWREPAKEAAVAPRQEKTPGVLEVSLSEWLERYQTECGQKECGAAG